MHLPQAVNSAAARKLVPPEFERGLARDYFSSVCELCQRFDGPPQKWRKRYEALLAGPGP